MSGEHEPTRHFAVRSGMTANPQNLGANQPISSEMEHETNYAVEVLQKEYPRIRADKIRRAFESARNAAAPSTDRWDILNRARSLLSNR
jgi:hypothetical protein